MRLPTYLQLEPVGQCNLRCQMCAIQFRQDGPPYGPPAFMPYDTFTRLIDEFDGLQELHLQGLGEPMMHPRFFDMVAYAAGRGVKVSTNSNLTLLNPKRAEKCVTTGLASLHVSLDGATAETFERIRVRAHFERVTHNIEMLVATRDRLGREQPALTLVTVIMRQNLHELPDLVRLAAGWSMEGMFVQHLCHDFGETDLPARYRPMHDFIEEQTLLAEDLGHIEDIFGEARRVAEEHGLSLRLPRPRPRAYPENTPGSERCRWPWTGAYVSYQGDAMPCCMVSTPDRINFGNMAESGVQTVWDNAAYEDFRRRLDSTDPPDICRSCALYAGIF